MSGIFLVSSRSPTFSTLYTTVRGVYPSHPTSKTYTESFLSTRNEIRAKSFITPSLNIELLLFHTVRESLRLPFSSIVYTHASGKSFLNTDSLILPYRVKGFSSAKAMTATNDTMSNMNSLAVCRGYVFMTLYFYAIGDTHFSPMAIIINLCN